MALKDRALNTSVPGFHLLRHMPAFSSFHHKLIISMCLEGMILIKLVQLPLVIQNGSKLSGDISQESNIGGKQWIANTGLPQKEKKIQSKLSNIILMT